MTKNRVIELFRRGGGSPITPARAARVEVVGDLTPRARALRFPPRSTCFSTITSGDVEDATVDPPKEPRIPQLAKENKLDEVRFRFGDTPRTPWRLRDRARADPDPP